MNNSRRKFLKNTAIAGAVSPLSGCSFMQVDTGDRVSSVLSTSGMQNKPDEGAISTQALQEKIEVSKTLVGETELRLMFHILEIENYSDYEEIIRGIQLRFSGKVDYLVGPETMKNVYDHVYSQKKELPKMIQERLDIDDQLHSAYEGTAKKGLGHPSSKWFYTFESQKHQTDFFEAGLEQYFELPDAQGKMIRASEPSKRNSIIVKKIGGKSIFLYYNPDGHLSFASTTSTGKKFESGGGKTEKYTGQYISGLQQLDKKSNIPKYQEAVMPFGVHVGGPIRIHGGAVTGEPASRGCIRLPYNAAAKFFEISKEQNINLEALGFDREHNNMRIFVEDN